VFERLNVPWAEILMGTMDVSVAIELSRKCISRVERIDRAGDSDTEFRVEGELLDGPEPSAKRVRKFASVNKYLDRIISGDITPSARVKIAATLGVSVGYLESLFGAKVRRISELYKEYRVGLSITRYEQFKEAVHKAMEMTMEEGEAPSWSNVAKHFPVDLQKRHSMKEMARVREEVLSEL